MLINKLLKSFFKEKVNRIATMLSLFAIAFTASLVSFIIDESKHTTEFVIEFCMHFAPDILTSLIVYLFLETGINFLFGMTKVSSRETADIINKINGAKKNVKILDTFISNLLFNKDSTKNEEFFSCLRAAWERGVKIQILLLHPASYAAKQRRKDLKDKKPTQDALVEMERGLGYLWQFWNEHNDNKYEKKGENLKKKGNLMIRIFNATPSFSLVDVDGHEIVSFYDAENSSNTMSNLETNTNVGFGDYTSEEFNKLWDLKSNLSIDNYMCMFHDTQQNETNLKAMLDKSIRLFYCGDNNDKFTPRFISFQFSDMRNTYFKNLIGKYIQTEYEGQIITIKILRRIKPENSDEYPFIVNLFRERYSYEEDGTNPIYEIQSTLEETALTITDKQVRQEFNKMDYVFVPAQKFAFAMNKVQTSTIQDWNSLPSYFDDLIIDKYLIAAGKAQTPPRNYGDRKRRFICFHLNRKEQTVTYDTTITEFIQIREYKDKFYEIPYTVTRREFSLLSPEAQANQFLKDLVKFNLELMVGKEESKLMDWHGYIHFFRVFANGDNHTGNPAPEGIHQDEHHYISIHFINKQNIEGGESRVHLNKEDESVLFNVTMNTTLDTLYINDSKLFHYVTPIKAISHPKNCYRDVMIIDYRKGKYPSDKNGK